MAAFDFSGKVVFVAGGTSGIILGIAEAFATAGADVVVISRSQDRVDAAVQRLRSRAVGSIFGFAADVRQSHKVAAALQCTQERLGFIDVLISAAAGNFLGSAAGMSSNAFKAVVDIDLLGTFNVLRAAHPLLRKPGASIVNVSAPQSSVAMPMQAHSCAAKAGVDMLIRVLAIEWGAEGVRVNAIAPGPIEETEGMARLAPSDAAVSWVAAEVPLRRLGRKQDVANLVMFLCSDLANYVTGAVVPVDGGWLANGARGLG